MLLQRTKDFRTNFLLQLIIFPRFQHIFIFFAIGRSSRLVLSISRRITVKRNVYVYCARRGAQTKNFMCSDSTSILRDYYAFEFISNVL